MSAAQRLKLASTAMRLVGVPYRHQGRSRTGLDCSGLVVYAHRLCGVDLPDRTDYSLSSDFGPVLLDLLAVDFTEWPQARLGDVVAIGNRGRASPPRHLGILAPARFGSGFDMVHACSDSKAIVRESLSEAWSRFVHSFHTITEWQR